MRVKESKSRLHEQGFRANYGNGLTTAVHAVILLMLRLVLLLPLPLLLLLLLPLILLLPTIGKLHQRTHRTKDAYTGIFRSTFRIMPEYLQTPCIYRQAKLSHRSALSP